MKTEKTDVLIVGGGLAGMSCAIKLSRAGLSVTIIEKQDRLGGKLNEITSFYNSEIKPQELLKGKILPLQSSDKTEVLLNTTLSQLSGEPGNFMVLLNSSDESKEVNCGAVIISTGAELGISDREKANLPADERIVSLSGFEKERKKYLESVKNGNKAILFLGSYSGSYLPVLSASMFYNASIALEALNVPVILAIPNAEVAREGVEELYRDAREKGVVLFKTTSKMPQITKEAGNIIAYIDDPYLKEGDADSPRVIVECGLIVLEDSVLPSAEICELSQTLRIKTHSHGSLQPDNPNLSTVDTNRCGIFICGSCRQVSEIQEVERDAGNAVAEVLRLLKGELRYSEEKIKVDKGKCTLCLTCYRVCPHSAITWSRAAEISQSTCMACGTCTSECPNRAITLSGYSDEDLYDAIERVL